MRINVDHFCLVFGLLLASMCMALLCCFVKEPIDLEINPSVLYRIFQVPSHSHTVVHRLYPLPVTEKQVWEIAVPLTPHEA